VSNAEAGGQPPLSNTGAITASAFVDWVSMTFPDVVRVQDVLEHLGGGFVQIEGGMFGYTLTYRRGNVSVYCAGREGMGIHVVISGKGCREMESRPSFSWSSFIDASLANGAKFTRLDIGADDRAGILSLETLEASCREGLVVSRYKKARGLWELHLDSTETVGQTLYFGSRSSDTMIRFYDKGKQLGVGESFVRMELEAKDKKAQLLAVYVADGREVGELLASVVSGLLDFKERGTHSQKERWARCAWWSGWLGAVEKLRLTVAPVVKTLEQCQEWLIKQCSASLSALYEWKGESADYLKSLLAIGRTRRKKWHAALLAAS
jgi:phage replication initiation protein